MTHLIRSLTAACVVAVMSTYVANSEPPSRAPRLAIKLRTRDKAEWPLLMIEGKPYFWGVTPRPRKAGDRAVDGQIDWLCNRFEIEGRHDTEIIAPGCQAFAGGPLYVDYSTTPPEVKMDPNSGKRARWNVENITRQTFSIGTIDDGGKTVWLSMGDVAFVRPTRDGKFVREFRPAIVSSSEKHVFELSGIDGK